MLSVIIATRESERALTPTLAVLVPGAIAGLVREVILADAGSRDATAEIADAAGCRFLVSDSPLAERLAQSAAAARAPWLLFLTAGAVPQTGWIEESSRFMDEAERAGRADAIAAVFRAVSPSFVSASPVREAVVQLVEALGLSRRPSHGLLIGKALYRRMVERRAAATQPSETDAIPDIIRRIGWRRIVTLRCGAIGP